MKSILFNNEDVKSILDNRKTVTRRLIKAAMPEWSFVELETDPYQTRIRKDGEMYPHKVNGLYAVFDEDCSIDFPMVKAPYQPGDVLYVRETWASYIAKQPVRAIPMDFSRVNYIYKADEVANSDGSKIKWHSPVTMPKEAARIFLRVTDVRVERLKEITIEQLVKEGCTGVRCDNCFGHGCMDCAGSGWQEPPIVEFVDTWNSTIKKSDLDKYGWDADPWVFVIEFERIRKEEA